MEVAAALTDKAHSVSVIGIETVPFKKALGEKVGKAIMKVGGRTLLGNQAFQQKKHVAPPELKKFCLLKCQ